MQQFQIIARNEKGEKYKEYATSANEHELRKIIHQRGHALIGFQVMGIKKSFFTFFRQPSISIQDLKIFVFYLYQLTKSGLTISKALEVISSQQEILQESRNKILSSIQTKLKEGLSFSDSLKLFPNIFDLLFITFIKVSEKTGNYTQALEALSRHLEWQIGLHASLKQEIRYPAVLLMMIAGVIVLLTHFVIPQLLFFMENELHQTPFSMSLFLYAAKVLEVIIMLCCLSIIIALGVYYGWSFLGDAFKRNIANAALKLPFFGRLWCTIDMAKMLYGCGLLLESRLDVILTLTEASCLLSNAHLKYYFLHAIKSVERGENLSTLFDSVPFFGSNIAQMVRVGETSGRLPDTFFYLAKMFEHSVMEQTHRFVKSIEPCALLVAGGVLLWIVMAVFLPLYSQLNMLEM